MTIGEQPAVDPRSASGTGQEALKHSVQGLQRVYQFIFALAIGSALSKLVLNAEGLPDLARVWSEGGVLFACFMATVVPFFHGMNRHLDDAYILDRVPIAQGRKFRILDKPGAILLDLTVFVLEAALIYVLAFGVLDRRAFFLVLSVLLAVDALWAFSTWLITGSSAIKWAIINILAAPALFVARGITGLEDSAHLVLLASLVVLRAIVDYWINREFYFPAAGVASDS